MHAGQRYTLKEFLQWTRRDIYWMTILAVIPTVLFSQAGWHWLAIPWVPIALIGTAAAFIVGFKNTQTYSRLWEARQNFGAIVSLSRNWGIMAKDFIGSTQGQTVELRKEVHEVHRQIIYRHLAWLTALRFQLRESRGWENMTRPHNLEFRNKFFKVPEHHSTVQAEMKSFLSENELAYVLGKKNRATHIIGLQSAQLKALNLKGWIDDFRHMEMQNLLKELSEQQGRCERIKNFPYPRQFASINSFFIHLFVILLPFGLLNEFHKMGENRVWLNIPFSILVGWVFNSMERVGESTENPFEGNANDVPITALSRTIEIDLREMLDEKDIPPALLPENNILM